MAGESELGARIVVRQARHRDSEAVGTFLLALSADSRYERFFSAVRVGPDLVGDLLTAPSSHLVLLACDGEKVVGHVMAVRTAEHTVDVGLVVAEAYQCRGIGSRLLHELTRTLVALGYTELRCDVLSRNRRVLEWLSRLLPDIRFERSGDTLSVYGSLVAQIS